jgi:hypothetical protein
MPVTTIFLAPALGLLHTSASGQVPPAHPGAVAEFPPQIAIEPVPAVARAPLANLSEAGPSVFTGPSASRRLQDVDLEPFNWTQIVQTVFTTDGRNRSYMFFSHSTICVSFDPDIQSVDRYLPEESRASANCPDENGTYHADFEVRLVRYGEDAYKDLSRCQSKANPALGCVPSGCVEFTEDRWRNGTVVPVPESVPVIARLSDRLSEDRKAVAHCVDRTSAPTTSWPTPAPTPILQSEPASRGMSYVLVGLKLIGAAVGMYGLGKSRVFEIARAEADARRADISAQVELGRQFDVQPGRAVGLVVLPEGAAPQAAGQLDVHLHMPPAEEDARLLAEPAV